MQLQTPIIIAVKMEKWNYAQVLMEELGGVVSIGPMSVCQAGWLALLSLSY